MNEENNISMDFEAERQLMSPIINISNDEISATRDVLFDPQLPESQLIQSIQSTELPQNEFIVSTKTSEISSSENLLPESQLISQNFSVELPEASFIVPTQTTDSFSSQNLEAQFSRTITPSSVNDDIDSLYQRTKSLEQNILDLQNTGDGWLKTKETNSFEERPIVEPNNLVFEQRKMRSSTLPEWA